MAMSAIAAQVAREGLTPDDYDEIVRRLGREPNQAELGMFGVMWSEHCCYRNSRPLLRGFPTEGPRILVGPGENAGVVDLGDGQAQRDVADGGLVGVVGQSSLGVVAQRE